MKLRTLFEELIAQTLANALRGQLALGPLDVVRLDAAACEIDAQSIAALALERSLVTDPRARDLVRRFALHQQIKNGSQGK